MVILANIELDHNKRPINEEVGLFRIFPNFLRETAFIDRFPVCCPLGLAPVSKDTPSKYIGLKGDIFGEILHSVRGDISYRDYVKTEMEVQNCGDMRDSKAVEAGATGLLKILFPDKGPSEEEFYKYCVNPALELRQRVRDELCKLDREYAPVTFKSRFPDDFQRNHRLVRYVTEQEAEVPPALLASPEPIQPADAKGTSERRSRCAGFRRARSDCRPEATSNQETQGSSDGHKTSIKSFAVDNNQWINDKGLFLGQNDFNFVLPDSLKPLRITSRPSRIPLRPARLTRMQEYVREFFHILFLHRTNRASLITLSDWRWIVLKSLGLAPFALRQL